MSNKLNIFLVADQIAVLKGGVLERFGPPEKILKVLPAPRPLEAPSAAGTAKAGS